MVQTQFPNHSGTAGAGLVELSALRSKRQTENTGFSEMFSVLLLVGDGPSTLNIPPGLEETV